MYKLLCRMSALLFLTVTLSLTNIALALTPDGETPAVETVCSEFYGAAFGLCNAYCEAMDCDSPDHKASDKACAKVADNFFKKTGEELICEAVEPPDPLTCTLGGTTPIVDGVVTLTVGDNSLNIVAEASGGVGLADFNALNEPSFTALINNGDNTATLSGTPELGDVGTYPNIVIQAVKGEETANCGAAFEIIVEPAPITCPCFSGEDLEQLLVDFNSVHFAEDEDDLRLEHGCSIVDTNQHLPILGIDGAAYWKLRAGFDEDYALALVASFNNALSCYLEIGESLNDWTNVPAVLETPINQEEAVLCYNIIKSSPIFPCAP